jgi:2-polyprenyl-3-methyl-5-hydroxy-6-metoxy-1,4-benzoquinol methylase
MDRRTRLSVSQDRGAACPLCGAEVRPGRRIEAGRLASNWKAHLGFNIDGELAQIDSISEHLCGCCGLVSYFPLVVGSERLYQTLQSFPWYYAGDRWEHYAALHDIPAGARLLEVGCGFGDFLEFVREKRDADARGVDLSSAAVAVAQRRGRSARVADAFDLSVEESGTYDVVCAFQVLEHVGDPAGFLRACVDLLKSGGRLCLGVPNNDGYLGKQRLDKAALNLPPHHVTRWGIRSLRSLEHLFPLQVRRIQCEPLTMQHIPEYITAQLDSLRIPGDGFLGAGLGWLASVALSRLNLRKVIHGHTVYASYTRLRASRGEAGPKV